MLTFPRVYPILDTEFMALRNLPVAEAAEGLIEGGARILQFRHKGFFSRDTYRDAALVAGLCRGAGTRFVINDRADIALLLSAGLHLGQDDLPAAEARKLSVSSLLGVSTHNEAQLLAAEAEPCDYVALGPIFCTSSKVNPDPIVGLRELARLRCRTLRPLIAIGGITLDNAADVWRATDSVAIIGDLYPGGATRQSIRSRMEDWVRVANE
ncbi:MAG: thiamine phosphate synthase [Bryobacteraceae bacterium]